MSTRGLLILALLVLIGISLVSRAGLLERASFFLRSLIAVLFIFFAVRAGISVAIIAFDLQPLSWLIPAAFGLAAWWLRPGRGQSNS